MTPQFWNHIQPQLDEQIGAQLSECNPPESLLQPLTNPLYWWQASPYRDMKFHYDRADMDIVGWLCAAEIIEGSDKEMNLGFIERIRDTIARQWAIRQSELAEEYEQERSEAA